MDRDTVIALARKAWDRDEDLWLTREQYFLERFAALVVAAEREECARICDKHWDDNGQHIANAIRSRT